MLTRRFLSQFDYFLFLAVVILALIGALGIYNASAEDGNYTFDAGLQGLYMGGELRF